MPPATPRPASVNDQVGTVKNLNDGIRGVLGVAGDIFSDRPGFIAGGGGGWPLADAVRAVSQYNCRVWARADKSGFSARVNAGNSALCTPYLTAIGLLPTEGDIGPAFKGGQCAGVMYGARYTYKTSPGATGISYVPSSGQFLPGGRNIYGPITVRGAKFSGAGSSFCGNPGEGSYEISGFDASGAVLVGALNLGGAECRFPQIIIEGLSFERLDAGAECGDPTPTYTPPGSTTGGPTDGPSININIPGVGPIDVTVTPSSEGNPIICYEQIDLCVEIPIGGGDGTGAPPGPPPGGGEPGTSDTASPGSDADGEAPPGEMLWGLKIGINSTPEIPNTYAPGVYRGVCYIYMGDEDGLDHDPAGAMLRDGQFVLAERDYLTRWRVAANPSYNLTVTPYYKPIEAEV